MKTPTPAEEVAALTIGDCRGCGRSLVSQSNYTRRRYLREHCVRIAGYGMCSACYVRAGRYGTLPDPAPLTPDTQAIPSYVSVSIRTIHHVQCVHCGLVDSFTRRRDAQGLVAKHCRMHGEEFDKLLEESSLGSPVSKAVQALTPADVVAELDIEVKERE